MRGGYSRLIFVSVQEGKKKGTVSIHFFSSSPSSALYQSHADARNMEVIPALADVISAIQPRHIGLLTLQVSFSGFQAWARVKRWGVCESAWGGGGGRSEVSEPCVWRVREHTRRLEGLNPNTKKGSQSLLLRWNGIVVMLPWTRVQIKSTRPHTLHIREGYPLILSDKAQKANILMASNPPEKAHAPMCFPNSNCVKTRLNVRLITTISRSIEVVK